MKCQFFPYNGIIMPYNSTKIDQNSMGYIISIKHIQQFFYHAICWWINYPDKWSLLVDKSTKLVCLRFILPTTHGLGQAGPPDASSGLRAPARARHVARGVGPAGCWAAQSWEIIEMTGVHNGK